MVTMHSDQGKILSKESAVYGHAAEQVRFAPKQAALHLT